jgi:uncharacterized damage-inducible protein DinB
MLIIKIKSMDHKVLLLKEWAAELASTRKILQNVPQNFDWKPHQKSMSLGRLATHLAEIPNWMKVTLETDELNFAQEEYQPKICKTMNELLGLFDKNATESTASLEAATENKMEEPWTMRNGGMIYFTMPKGEVVRTWVINHLIHHRAQLGVYLRLLDIPVPGAYGPSADGI